MIKLMIVDDEPLFREYLRTTIDFETYGFTLIGEAKNGKEALALAEEMDPDIVLTDINMPLMDGLTLSEKLLAANPDMGIVLISGHSEFEYARRAVKIGVCDYILKPFDKEELILTLLKLKDNIYRALEVTTDSDSEQIKMSLLRSLINGELLPKPELMEELRALGLSRLSDRYVVTTLSIDNIDEKWDQPEEKMLWRFAVSNILNELMEELMLGNHHSFYDHEGNVVSLLEVPASVTTVDTSYHDGLKQLVNRYLNFSITLGVGSVQTGLLGVRKSYEESVHALSARFMLGTNRAIYYENLPEKSRDLSFYNAGTHEQLIQLLRKSDSRTLMVLLDTIFEDVHKRPLEMAYIRMIYMSMISIVLSHIVQSGNPVNDILGDDFSPMAYLNEKSTIDVWEKQVRTTYEKTLSYQTDQRDDRTQQVAQKAVDYIEDNYMDNGLSVSMVAKALLINQTYLRSMFKEAHGSTISDFITKTRMNKAMGLLKEKRYMLADIADQVGYSDASYFSKCFKKYYGKSPSQYERTL